MLSLETDISHSIPDINRSIVRKILLHRYCSWIDSVFCPIQPVTFENFQSYYKMNTIKMFMCNNFESDKYSVNHSNMFGHELIQYVWDDLFIIDVMQDNCNYMNTITYKNIIHTPKSFNVIYFWNMKEKKFSNEAINLFDYVLGIESGRSEDLQFISNSIDDHERNMILKLLLLRRICNINYVCTDIINLILYRLI